MALLWGPLILHRLILRKSLKIFLSEIGRPRILIFGIQLHLMDLNNECSNFRSGAHMFYIDLYRENI